MRWKPHVPIEESSDFLCPLRAGTPLPETSVAIPLAAQVHALFLLVVFYFSYLMIVKAVIFTTVAAPHLRFT